MTAPHSRPPVPRPLAVLLLAGLLLTGCAGTDGPPAGKDAQTADSLIRVASTALAGGDMATAANLFTRARQQQPDRVEPHLALGEIAWRTGTLDSALASYRRAAALEPGNHRAQAGLARTLLALDRPDEALPAWQAALAGAPADPRLLNGLAVTLDRLGRHAAAVEAFEKGLRAAPDNLALRTNLGLSLALHGAGDRGLALMEQAAADPRAGEKQRANLAAVRRMLSGAGAVTPTPDMLRDRMVLPE